MLRFFVSILLILCLYVYLNPPLYLSPAPSLPGQIEIIAQPGVSDFEIKAVHRAAAHTAHFFGVVCHRDLSDPVTIILTVDSLSFLHTLTQDEGLDANSALFFASLGAGVNRGHHIVLNTGLLPQYNDLIFVTAHELTHQYQFHRFEASSRYNWLVEGMADAIAAHVVAANLSHDLGQSVLTQYRQNWLKSLSGAKRFSLGMLDSRQEWNKAMQQNAVAAYRTAGLAAMLLVDRYGFESLMAYVTLCDNGMEAEQAFRDSFGTSFNEFSRQYDDYLAVAVPGQ